MEKVQILYDYIYQKEQEKAKLLTQLQTYVEDIKEVLEIHNVLHDNHLTPYPYNSSLLSDSCNIFWLPFDKENYLRMVLTEENKAVFLINGEGKYHIGRPERSHVLVSLSLEDENKYLSTFCKWFPEYRDNVFKYVENFRIKEI